MQGNSDMLSWPCPRWKFTNLEGPLSGKQNPVPLKGKASPYLSLCLW